MPIKHNLLEAQYERVRPLARNDQIRQAYTHSDHPELLSKLVVLVDRLSLATRPIATISSAREIPSIRVSKSGKQFVECLERFVPIVCMRPAALRFDPRLQALVDVLEPSSLPPQFRPSSSRFNSPDGLNGIVHELRTKTTTRTFQRALLKHQARFTERLKRLRAYFFQVARSEPDGVVHRIELREKTCSPDPWSGPAFFSDAVALWLQRVREVHGNTVRGLAWKLAIEGQEGWSMHLTMVTRNHGANHQSDLSASLFHLWKEHGGAGASIVDCNDPLLRLKYRGHSSELWNSYLSEQLDFASVYLVKTDLLWHLNVGFGVECFGFGDQVPASLPF